MLQEAWALLGAGPASTERIARKVLRIRGNPGAAAAAVHALLGGDDRFRADDEGRWTLRAAGRAPGRPLSRLEYAVVDVETTGGTHHHGHRMTEVAVVEVSGGRIGERFHTLLHPGRRIPAPAARLTGITDRMVAAAPAFDDVAEELFKRLDGRVFVAHNVAFDWGWVRAQLADALGDVPDVPRLCTVSLARRLAPELRHRNLDALADHFDVPIDFRHRAHGDALATARVLVRLLHRAENLGIGDLHALKRHRPERSARPAVRAAGRTAPRSGWTRARRTV